MYADFETFNKPMNESLKGHDDEDDNEDDVDDDDRDNEIEAVVEEEEYEPPLKIRKEDKLLFEGYHSISGYTIHVVSSLFQQEFPPISYRQIRESDLPAGEMFIYHLKQLDKKVQSIYETKYNALMQPLTKKQIIQFKKADRCYLCSKRFQCKVSFLDWKESQKLYTDNYNETTKIFVSTEALLGPKVMDHDHWTGIYRGPAHAKCNLQFYEQKKLIVFFHGGSNFDFHLLIQSLKPHLIKDKNQKKKIFFHQPKIIAKTLERFVQIDMKTIVFKDSYNFLQSSLDKMVQNLKKKAEQLGGGAHAYQKYLNIVGVISNQNFRFCQLKTLNF